MIDDTQQCHKEKNFLHAVINEVMDFDWLFIGFSFNLLAVMSSQVWVVPVGWWFVGIIVYFCFDFYDQEDCCTD